MRQCKRFIASALTAVMVMSCAAMTPVTAAAGAEVFPATPLIDSPYDFNLPGQADYFANPMDAGWDTARIFKEIRAFYPEEVPVVMPKKVEGNTIYHVSPSGSDDNDGSLASPFRTIACALSRVASLDQAARDQGVVVYLHGGNYKLTSPLQITGAMSGSADFPLYIAAYDGEDVTLTSSDTLTESDFQPVTDQARLALLPEKSRGKVVVADLPALGLAPAPSPEPTPTPEPGSIPIKDVNFENAPYTAGQSVVGVDGWNVMEGTDGADGGAVVAADPDNPANKVLRITTNAGKSLKYNLSVSDLA
ncbi:MAG: hypothetical protein FWC55_10100, partial [Firmicutes bacterium]|nr:hypothetical protein [Bacillota bacterium]